MDRRVVCIEWLVLKAKLGLQGEISKHGFGICEVILKFIQMHFENHTNTPFAYMQNGPVFWRCME